MFFLWQLTPFWMQSAATTSNTTNKKSIDVFYANTNTQNLKKEILINHLSAKKPDLVLMVEVNLNWAQKLKSLKKIYPFSQFIIRENNFGMAIMSKFPLELEDVFIEKKNMVPALFVQVKSSPKPFKAFLLHSFPPIGRYATLLRDQYLNSLSQRLSHERSPLLICGDFNTTPWTSIFKTFLKNLNIETSKVHRLNTWPTKPFSLVPIDHCISKQLNIINYQAGPYIGSDHKPLELEIEF